MINVKKRIVRENFVVIIELFITHVDVGKREFMQGDTC
jgi:hypothetical protein